MKFGIGKCAKQIMRSKKRLMREGIELPKLEKIRTFGEKKTYKYLGIFGEDTINQLDRKDIF